VSRFIATVCAISCCIMATAGADVLPCPDAKPLGAHVELRLAHSEPSFTRDSRVRVWFALIAPDTYGTYAARLMVPWAAKEMTWRTTANACRDGTSFGTCSCPATRASGTADLSGFYATYDASDPDLSLMFPDVIEASADVRVKCIDGGNEVGETGAGLALPATFAVRPRRTDSDGLFQANASGCYDENRQKSEECVLHPERFAVMPLAGNGVLDSSDGGFRTSNNARWEVCCGCGIPPRDGMEGETGDCGDAAQQRGLFEVAIDSAKALRAELGPRVDRFQQEKRLAEQYRADFELVSSSCAGWDISIELLKGLLGGTNAPESAKTLVQIMDLLDKLVDEDPSILLNVVEGLPLPESLEFTFIGADDFTLGTLWDGVSTVYEGALEVDQAGSIPQMQQRLEDCAGVPLVSNLVYDDAKQHLRHLEAAVRELPAIRELTTRIEQADTEVYNRWVAYHAACLEEAECRGTDPATCGPAPP